MNLFELFVKIDVDDKASGKIGKITQGLGKGLATAAKIGTAAVGAAAAGITALTTTAVKSFAEYEQLIGGAELMFGEAFETVKKNAQDAYKTVQMSQNEYLQQVNGFATGLKTALGGNEQAAAELSHNIIAATGNAAENVQNAFNGIMKSNFTMLDNLQIGITPTKEGFQEVIDKVNEWNKTNGEATEYQMGNLADMQSALVDYIDMVGMSGYSQREASETITGSLSSMKAAWTNLVTGFADDSTDLDELIDNLANSVVGFTDESGKQVKGVLDNLLPAIEKSLGGIAKFIEGAAPKIIEILPGLAERVVPSVISAATGMVEAFVKVVPDLLNTVVDAIIEGAPTLIDSTLVLIGELSNGILSQLPKIIQLGLDLIVSLVDGLTNENGVKKLLDSAVYIIFVLVNGLTEALPQLINAASQIIINLVDYIADPENLAKLIAMALNLVVEIGKGLVLAAGELAVGAAKLVTTIVDNVVNTDWVQVGKDVISFIWQGLQEAWGDVTSWFSDTWSQVKKWFHNESTDGGGVKMDGRSFPINPSSYVDGIKGKVSEPVKKVLEQSQGLDFVSGINNAIKKQAETISKVTDTIIDSAEYTSEELEKIEEERLEKQKNLREEFLDFVESTTSQMVDLEQEYQDKLAERSQTIENSYDIFEKVAEREKVNYIELLDNLARQNANVERFYSNIEKLRARGVGEGLINELIGKGVSASDEVQAIVDMNNEYLSEYVSMYEKRAEIADKYANIQLSGEKKTLETNLATMFDSISAVYDENAEELGVSFIEGFIQKIKDGTANIAKALQETISTAMAQAMGTQSALKMGTANESFASSLSKAFIGAIKGDNNSSGLGVYLDGNTLVGGISDRMNSNLGENYSLDTRGAMA